MTGVKAIAAGGDHSFLIKGSSGAAAVCERKRSRPLHEDAKALALCQALTPWLAAGAVR